MNVGRLNAARSTVVAVVFGVLLFVILVNYAPDSVSFSPNNYGWDGIRGVYLTYRINFTNSISSVPINSTFVVLQPNTVFSPADIEVVRTHLTRGGVVLVADNSGVANSLLRGLGSGIVIQSDLSVNDPTYNWRAQSLPTAFVLSGAPAQFRFAANVSAIALDKPSPLLLKSSADVSIASTSPFSFDEASSGTGKVAHGPFVVIAAEKVGTGTLVVIGDPQLLLNAEWTISDNPVLIRNLFSGTKVFIDASHWTAGPLTSSTAQVKAGFGELFDAISGVPAKYVVTVLFIGFGLAMVPSAERRRERRDVPEAANNP